MAIPGAVPASMGKRLLAFLLDGVAAGLLGGAVVAASIGSMLRDPTSPAGPPGTGAFALLGIGAFLLVAFGVAQWVLLGTRGWTVGKRLVGLRVLSPETGRPVGLGRAFVRLLIPAAGSLVVVGQLVVHLSPFFDRGPMRRGWHDYAAGTVVYDVQLGADPSVEGAGRHELQRIDRILAASAARAAQPPPAISPLPSAPAPAPAVRPAPTPIVAVPESLGPLEQTLPPAALRTPEDAMISRVPVTVDARAGGRADDAPSARHVRTAPDIDESVGRPHPDADDSSGGHVAHGADGAPSSGQDVPAPPMPPAPPARPRGRRAAGPADDGPVPGADHGGTDRGGAGPEGAGPEGAGPQGADRDPEPGRADAPVSAPLDDDVERTRLRPARSRVPEVPDDVGPVSLDLTDGRRIELTGTALVGRNPSARTGEVVEQLIAVADPERSVSKTHLAVGVDRAGVWLRDRGSTNGTVVTLADGQQILCGPDQQVRLPAGASVAFGDYGFTVAVG